MSAPQRKSPAVFSNALLTAAFTAVVISPVLAAQSEESKIAFSANALVVERTTIPATVHKNREIVLWMDSPVKNDRGPFSASNPYTCPELTLGSYYSGPTRISLVDTSTNRIINTIRLLSEDEGSFNVPYRILSDYYYLVPRHPKGTEGRPALLALRDLNGDGLALEAPFFEAVACMGLPTTLVGYSPRQDKVIQYQAELKVTNFRFEIGAGKIGKGARLGESSRVRLLWIDYLFAKKPITPGRWKYEIDYLGRGGTLDSYEIHYDPSREKFLGTLTRLCPEDLPEANALPKR